MPALAALIGGGFVQLMVWLTTFVGKKAAVGTAMGVFLVSGWIALQVCQIGIWNGLSWSLGGAASAFMIKCLSVVAYMLPLSFNQFVQAIIMGKFCRWLWDRHREWAKSIAAS